MTWQNIPPPQPWNPPPAPQIVNRGIQGRTNVKLDKAIWISMLRLESKCPDAPSSETNDHYRTIYAQRSPGQLSNTSGDTPIRLGIVLRFRFGIGNGQMETFYDVPSNGIVHAAVSAERVEVDAATVQVYFDETEDITEEDVDNPDPILADTPPLVTVGVIQNQALAMNEIQTPKRIFVVEVPATPPLMANPVTRIVPIPKGSQSILIVGDPTKLSPVQTLDTGIKIPMPVNDEVPLGAGIYQIELQPLTDAALALVIFGLGI